MRKPAVLAVLAVLLAAGALLGLSWLRPSAPSGPVQVPPGAASAPPTQEQVVAPVPGDPAEIDRLAALEEARARYAALRDGFLAARPSAASRARLEPAVRSLWPHERRWDLACRGLVCRVTPREAPEGWRTELEADPGVRQVAERLAFDPESVMAPAFVLLLPMEAEPPRPGKADEFLRGIEAAVRESPEVARCLADAEKGRALELHLRVDRTGLTYRMAAGLGPGPSLCASMALAEVMASPVPPGAGGAERTVVVNAP